MVAKTARAGHFDAFVSYAREDLGMAQRLAGALAAQGKNAWVDVEDILGGADWLARIRRGIEACTVTPNFVP